MRKSGFLGIDIGSISVKCALIDAAGHMLHDAYIMDWISSVHGLSR